MNTEQKDLIADTAWKMCWRTANPMPAIIARDWVMNEIGCERKEAVQAIAQAAGRLLSGLQPTKWNERSKSGMICAYVSRMFLHAAWVALDELKGISTAPAMDELYLAWCEHAARVLRLLKEFRFG